MTKKKSCGILSAGALVFGLGISTECNKILQNFQGWSCFCLKFPQVNLKNKIFWWGFLRICPQPLSPACFFWNNPLAIISNQMERISTKTHALLQCISSVASVFKVLLTKICTALDQIFCLLLSIHQQISFSTNF